MSFYIPGRTKFSQFNNVGNILPGDLLAGLRNGRDVLLSATAIPGNNWVTLIVGGPLLPNVNYFIANSLPQTFTLPAVFPFGETITLINIGTSTFTVDQNAGQQIQFGNVRTTLGVGGSIESLNPGDSATLVCAVANNFIVTDGAPEGIWNVV